MIKRYHDKNMNLFVGTRPINVSIGKELNKT